MKQILVSMMIFVLMLSTAWARFQTVILPSDSVQKYQDFLKRNPTYLSLSQFWIESFQESELQLESLLDLCILELTASPSPESCEVYFKRRAEVPMGSFDHKLFVKLASRLQSDRFKDEKIKEWLDGAQAVDSKDLVSSADLKLLIQRSESSKILAQGLPVEDQTLSRSKIYQWTLLKDDSYPLTALASYEELLQAQMAWIKVKNEDLKTLAKKFSEKIFIRLNSKGEIDDLYESQLSPFQSQTQQQLSEQKSWGRQKLPLILLVTGVLVHSLKDKEIKFTGFSF